MTDKELLELAAKAAGIEHAGWCEEFEGLKIPVEGFRGYWVWDPLSQDDLALKLAVKLGLELRMSSEFVIGVIPRYTDNEMFEPKNEDPYAATRRAIVRAAAILASEKQDQPEPKFDPEPVKEILHTLLGTER